MGRWFKKNIYNPSIRRTHGRGQMNYCLICGDPKIDRCHIRSKGAGGPNDDFNILLMCRKHHQEQHRVGWSFFSKKYFEVRKALESKGWEWDESLSPSKLWNDKLRT